MSSFLQDLRTAIRALRKSPATTALAIVCLALGIAAGTTVFSLTDTFWLRALPVRAPDRLVELYTVLEGQRGRMSYADVADYRQRSRTLAGLAASARYGPVLATAEGPGEATITTVVTENYFTVLGVEAAHGRLFTEADAASTDLVLVLSHGLWQRRFGGDPGVVGTRVTLGRRSYTVVGILGREFHGTEPSIDIDAWVPFSSWFVGSESRKLLADRTGREFDVIGRLRPGVSREQARSELQSITSALERAYPATNRGTRIDVVPAGGDPGYQPYLLLGLVILVLLIACANVANLLLARAEGRRREIAIRQALGASRWRVARQMLGEAAVLAGVSTLVALLIAWWSIRVLPAVVIAPSTVANAWEFLLDARAVAFTLAAAVLTALACSVAPALSSSGSNLALFLGSERAGGRTLRAPVRNVLVIGQVTLAVVTLTCAGLLLDAFILASRVNLGFARKDMLLVHVYTPYRPPEARAFFQQLLDRLHANPAVRNATTAMRPPMWPSEGGRSILVAVPGWTGPAGETALQIKEGIIGPDYFRMLGTRILQGRDFGAQDVEGGRKVTIVNATMARRFWPRESAVGTIVRVGPADKAEEREVVGVVEDTKINSADEPPEAYLYLPFAQVNATYQNVMIENARGSAGDLARLVRSEVTRLDKRVMIYEMWTMRDLVRSQFFDREMPATVVGSLGVLGLILAIAGLYGVVSYAVACRTHEIGVRMALGAEPRDALGLVLWHGLRLALAGVAAGVAASAAVTPLLAHWLHGVSPRDPVTLAAVAGLMVVVALAASFFPARRATRVDPVIALRYE
jgi:predicted permease